MDKYEIRRQNVIFLITTKFKGSRKKFSAAVGIDYSYVSRMLYEPGKKFKKNIGEEVSETIEDALDLTRHWLDTIQSEAVIKEPEAIYQISRDIEIDKIEINFLKIPIINQVQAGSWTEIKQSDLSEEVEYVMAPCLVSNDAYALRIAGDSMFNPYHKKSISHGSIVIIEPHRAPKDQDIVVALLDENNEATIKQLIIDGPLKYLRPLNPQYKPVEINGNCTIIGVAIKQVLDL